MSRLILIASLFAVFAALATVASQQRHNPRLRGVMVGFAVVAMIAAGLVLLLVD